VIRRLALAIAAGAIACSLCDHLHVAFGVLAYAHPDVWGQAYWVPLLFAGSTAAVIAGAFFTRAVFDRGSPAPGAGPVSISTAGAACLFVAAYVMTAIAHAYPDLTLWVLAGAWVARVAWRTPRWLIVSSLSVAVAGPCVEATLSGIGLFAYAQPDLLGFPRWLPALYLHAGLAAGKLLPRLESGRRGE
jgi:hypothetical protein